MLHEMVFFMRVFGFAVEFLTSSNASPAIASWDETKLGFYKQLKAPRYEKDWSEIRKMGRKK